MMTDCPICAHARAHGAWGQPGTHCRECHRSWTSTAQAHCTACHQQFGSNRIAEMHWVRGEHRDPRRVASLAVCDETYGSVWRRNDPMSTAALVQIRQDRSTPSITEPLRRRRTASRPVHGAENVSGRPPRRPDTTTNSSVTTKSRKGHRHDTA